MNQVYNTRDAVVLRLNVKDLWKSFTCLCYALEYLAQLLFVTG